MLTIFCKTLIKLCRKIFQSLHYKSYIVVTVKTCLKYWSSFCAHILKDISIAAIFTMYGNIQWLKFWSLMNKNHQSYTVYLLPYMPGTSRGCTFTVYLIQHCILLVQSFLDIAWYFHVRSSTVYFIQHCILLVQSFLYIAWYFTWSYLHCIFDTTLYTSCPVFPVHRLVLHVVVPSLYIWYNIVYFLFSLSCTSPGTSHGRTFTVYFIQHCILPVQSFLYIAWYFTWSNIVYFLSNLSCTSPGTSCGRTFTVYFIQHCILLVQSFLYIAWYFKWSYLHCIFYTTLYTSCPVFPVHRLVLHVVIPSLYIL